MSPDTRLECFIRGLKFFTKNSRGLKTSTSDLRGMRFSGKLKKGLDNFYCPKDMGMCAMLRKHKNFVENKLLIFAPTKNFTQKICIT